VGSNSEIQGYNLYPMLHFCRKFAGSITLGPVFFLSSLGNFGYYVHSSLRLFVFPLFLIETDQL